MGIGKQLEQVLNQLLPQDSMSNKGQTHTRRINPKLGLLGLLGILGFSGFLPDALMVFNPRSALTAPIFFFFFGFFGFFGFYYEGKLSNTLIDERFVANSHRATALANRASLLLIFFASIFVMTIIRIHPYHMLGIFIAIIGLAFGLAFFLQSYLLYRFETEE